MRQFHRLSPNELAALDIAEVNLECATDLPGSENLDIPAALSMLDEWAEAIRLATARHWQRFERQPSEFEGSVPYFCMLVMVTVLHARLSGNSAPSYAGVFVAWNAGLTIVNTTITENAATSTTGGIYASDANSQVTLYNTIVAGNHDNSSNGTHRDVGRNAGSFNLVSSSKNLIGVVGGSGLTVSNGIVGNESAPKDPGLTPLGDYGGPTKTHALLPTSQALDTGLFAKATEFSIFTDQRGYHRSIDQTDIASNTVDIGAYELGLVVSTANDVVDGNHSFGHLSLRESLALADQRSGKNQIEFDPALLTNDTIRLTQQLNINSDVDIIALGADKLTIDAQGASRVFYVNSGLEAAISGLTITRGRLASGNHGAGIYNKGALTLDHVNIVDNHVTEGAGSDNGGGIFSESSLTIIDSTVENNSARSGGGVAVLPTNAAAVLDIRGSAIINNRGNIGGGLSYIGAGASVTIRNSTFSGNVAPWRGGGLWFNAVNTPVTIVNSTIAYNTAEDGGAGGLHSDATTTTLLNTIIAKNVAPTFSGGTEFHTHDDIWSTVSLTASSTHNLVGNVGWSGLSNAAGLNNVFGTEAAPLNAGLAPLGNYGGPTKTHALLSTSPAIDSGSNAIAASHKLGTDQRGFKRLFDDGVVGPQGRTIDKGASELGQVVALNADFDGNGFKDYATYDSHSGLLVAHLGTIQNTSQTATATLDANYQWDTFQVGDFNGDQSWESLGSGSAVGETIGGCRRRSRVRGDRLWQC